MISAVRTRTEIMIYRAGIFDIFAYTGRSVSESAVWFDLSVTAVRELHFIEVCYHQHAVNSWAFFGFQFAVTNMNFMQLFYDMSSKTSNSQHSSKRASAVLPGAIIVTLVIPTFPSNFVIENCNIFAKKVVTDKSKSVTDPRPGAGGLSPMGSAGPSSPSYLPFFQQQQIKSKKTSKSY
ncbi:hypothetical protein CPC08DRAFT_727204 [Agrocybe pediades]|nr:hypothetical protein CPC08DRAFT_727204 [Agrocybe pediades]